MLTVADTVGGCSGVKNHKKSSYFKMNHKATLIDEAAVTSNKNELNSFPKLLRLCSMATQINNLNVSRAFEIWQFFVKDEVFKSSKNIIVL